MSCWKDVPLEFCNGMEYNLQSHAQVRLKEKDEQRKGQDEIKGKIATFLGFLDFFLLFI